MQTVIQKIISSLFLGVCIISSNYIYSKEHTKTQVIFSVSAKKNVFRCTLSANRTTGYRWFLVNNTQNVLHPVKQIYINSTHKLGVTGSPGYSVWDFQCNTDACLIPQIVKLTFWYMRPWEKKAVQKKKIYVAIIP